MPKNKVRLIDTDVISNIILMHAKSDIFPNVNSSNSNISLWTTRTVEKEINNRFKRAKDRNQFGQLKVRSEEIQIMERSWKNIKGIFQLKTSVQDPSELRNAGEKSLVSILPLDRNDVKIVSNNRKDVLNYLKAKVPNPQHYYISPFEFYEQMYKDWFKNYQTLVRFLILSNHDFKVIENTGLGDILKKVPKK